MPTPSCPPSPCPEGCGGGDALLSARRAISSSFSAASVNRSATWRPPPLGDLGILLSLTPNLEELPFSSEAAVAPNGVEDGRGELLAGDSRFVAFVAFNVPRVRSVALVMFGSDSSST